MKSATQIRQSLEMHRARLPYSDAIADWLVEVGADATGDESVWVWIILRDERLTEVWPVERRSALREAVRDHVAHTAAPLAENVYIRFRTASEQREVAAEGRVR